MSLLVATLALPAGFVFAGHQGEGQSVSIFESVEAWTLELWRWVARIGPHAGPNGEPTLESGLSSGGTRAERVDTKQKIGVNIEPGG